MAVSIALTGGRLSRPVPRVVRTTEAAGWPNSLDGRNSAHCTSADLGVLQLGATLRSSFNVVQLLVGWASFHLGITKAFTARIVRPAEIMLLTRKQIESAYGAA